MSNLTNISLETVPDSRIIDGNFHTLNTDKLEIGNIIQGENIQITIDDKNIIISATQGAVGQDGISLQYHWNGTSLGIKREDEINYTYVNLKGQDGIIGSDGKSAYQSWLDLGNTGTEQDFINSNKGENGIDGVDGRNIELRYSETYLQYRLVGDVYWINLIQLTQPEIDLITLTNRVDVLETNQGDLTSVPTELQNKTIAEMITTNFTSVSNGKGLIANAITDKGVQTLATDTFQVMADNIGLISGGGESPSGGSIDEFTYLMLHGEDFTDSSFNPKAIVNNGATLVNGKFGNAIQTNNTNTLRIGATGDYNFLHNGLEDYVIDFWFKPNGKNWYIHTNNATSSGVGFMINYTTTTQMVRFWLARGVNQSFPIDVSIGIVDTTKFTHIAIQHSEGRYSAYVDGILKFMQAPSVSLSTANHSAVFTVGYLSIDSCEIIDEFRITRGKIVYGDNFTPRNSPYTVDLESYSTMLEEQIIESEYQNL